MEEPAEDFEDRLDTFKEEKCKAKKKTLLETDDHPPRRNEVRNECENLDLMLEAAL